MGGGCFSFCFFNLHLPLQALECNDSNPFNIMKYRQVPALVFASCPVVLSILDGAEAAM